MVADAPQQIERKVGELVDWLVAADLRQWQAVTTHLAERRRQYRDRIVGDDAGAVPLRPDAADRLGGPRGAASRRLLRSTARGAAARGQRAECRCGGRGGRRRRARPRHDRHHRCNHCRRRHHRHRPRVGRGGDRILHPAGEAHRRRKRRCGGRSRDVRAAAVGRAAEAVRAGDQRSGDRIRESIAPYSRFIRSEGDKLKRSTRNSARSRPRLPVCVNASSAPPLELTRSPAL